MKNAKGRIWVGFVFWTASLLISESCHAGISVNGEPNGIRSISVTNTVSLSDRHSSLNIDSQEYSIPPSTPTYLTDTTYVLAETNDAVGWSSHTAFDSGNLSKDISSLGSGEEIKWLFEDPLLPLGMLGSYCFLIAGGPDGNDGSRKSNMHTDDSSVNTPEPTTMLSVFAILAPACLLFRSRRIPVH